MTRSVAQRVDLNTFDGQLIDGLEFCSKVYDLFEQTKQELGGVAVLRLRSTKLAKRLLEELLPLARFVQSRYREGRRIQVRWRGGSQPYDAILWSSGELVERRAAARRQIVEITVAVHQHHHLAREQLHKSGMSWGAKSISRNPKTREVVSHPYVYSNDERASDLAEQILNSLHTKAARRYPPGTALIVSCDSEGLLLEDEWDAAVQRVRETQPVMPFREVFLVETSWGFSATLHGNEPVPRSRGARKKRNI